MPQSLVHNPMHLVFSTKNRKKWLKDDLRSRTHAYLARTLLNLDCYVIEVGGVEDHVHLLFDLNRKLSLSEVAGKVKTGASAWLKREGIPDFAWQSGYAGFGVGLEREGLVAYIRNQEEHHRHVDFQDELRRLLTEHKISFDEAYLWD